MNGQLKSKTNWYGVIVLCLGVVQGLMPDLKEQIGEWYAPSLMVIGCGIIVLRQFTTTPVNEK